MTGEAIPRAVGYFAGAAGADFSGRHEMPDLMTTIRDAVDALVRRMNGERLCAFCKQWAKKPHRSGSEYFCDRIHASVFYKQQQETMRRALEKKRAAESASAAKPKDGSPGKTSE